MDAYLVEREGKFSIKNHKLKVHEIQNIFNINMVNFRMGKLGFYFTNISISAFGNQKNL